MDNRTALRVSAAPNTTGMKTAPWREPLTMKVECTRSLPPAPCGVSLKELQQHRTQSLA